MTQGVPIAALVAWLLAATYYFYQYALRSAPSVMMPQLAEAFDANALGVAAIVGMFYYGYSPFSLVAGASIDRFGAKKVVPIGAALVGAGALAFSSGDAVLAGFGRFLQGAGGVFALVGAIYIATKRFPPAYAASLIGATQMFGMAGGTAGQFLVGPAIDGGLPWDRFWLLAGFGGLAISGILFVLLPKDAPTTTQRPGGFGDILTGFRVVFANPQSILCGIIAGLLFIPTTIFDMTWGVRFLQEGRGREYEDAVRIAASVPFGWMIGSPLLGFVSDRIGRRKPVIFVGTFVLFCIMAYILYGTTGIFRGAAVGIVMGIASGAAMLPTTVIKEANPPELGGTATGVATFINFTFSALLGPVFGRLMIGATPADGKMSLEHYQATFAPMLVGLLVAMILIAFLKETGPAAGAKQSTSPASPQPARRKKGKPS